MTKTLIHPKMIYGSIKVSGPVCKDARVMDFFRAQMEELEHDAVVLTKDHIKQLFTDGRETDAREHDVQNSKGE